MKSFVCFYIKKTEFEIKRFILYTSRYKYFNDDDYGYFKRLIDKQENDIKKLIK